MSQAWSAAAPGTGAAGPIGTSIPEHSHGEATMALQQTTRAFLAFLHANPQIRKAIRPAPDRAFLYAGTTIRASALGVPLAKPMWKEILDLKAAQPEYRDKDTLPDVLARIPTPGAPHATLLAYIQAVEATVPWHPDGFGLWRALSGIYASNVTGRVSFYIGAGITPASKVFAATEVAVLARNPKIDATTRDLLSYYQRCIQRGDLDINVTFLSA
jgi:hypothetical protein